MSDEWKVSERDQSCVTDDVINVICKVFIRNWRAQSLDTNTVVLGNS